MTHLGLFEGIGGFSLAARWAGWETVAWSEWNEFGQKVLRHHFPEAEGHGDITKTDFRKYAGKIDILTGGFPCQPYSQAGKRKGKDDERHLWPEMLRAIREVRPRYVVGENVRGLTNWNGGLVFDEVQADLEAEGYEVTPFLLPACAVNAPHRRDRIWFVAHANSNGQHGSNCEHEKQPSERGQYAQRDVEPATMHTNSTSGQGEHIRQTREGKFNRSDSRDGFNNFQNFPTQSPICGRNDGLPAELDGITFSKWRNESIKAYGNAIVPQVALEIFKAINEMEKLTNTDQDNERPKTI